MDAPVRENFLKVLDETLPSVDTPLNSFRFIAHTQHLPSPM